MRTHAPLAVADYLAVARQIAEGLAAAHARGILHRDVKPANILARREGERWRVKLIDFGLATRHGVVGDRTTTRAALTPAGRSVAGTLAYAAPEQLRGETVGPTADVYAFARTSCQLLFGTTHPLPRHWQDCPAALAALLGRCLEEDPADRPEDFAAVLSLLEAATPNTGFAPMQPMRPMQPFRPMVFDAQPVEEGPARGQEKIRTFDVEAYTSVLELVRLIRRFLVMELREIAGAAQFFPSVARSEAGGFEPMRPRLAGGDTIQPIYELKRMIVEEEQQGRRLDDRLAGQLAAMTAEARTRLAATPVPVVASGCAALAVLALCPFFGFTISLSQVGSSSFATSIVLTASTGVALLFGGSFAIFYQVQHSRLKQFGRGVVTSIEPLLPRAPSPIPPVVTWPSARAAGVRNILILVAAGVATASLSGLFLSLLYG